MFVYKRTIHLHETDATGVLYFTEQLKLALEALEAYFLSKGFSIHDMINNKEFLLPIVHAEADFMESLKVGDEVLVQLTAGETGVSSFALLTNIFNPKKDCRVGTTKVVHVAVERETGKSTPIPAEVLSYLKDLS